MTYMLLCSSFVFSHVTKALRNIRDSVRYNGLKNELGKKDFDAVVEKALAKVNAGGDSVGCIDLNTGKHELSGEVGEEAGGGTAAPTEASSGCRSPLSVVQAPSQLAADSPAPGELAPRRRSSGDDSVAARSGALFLNMASSFSAVGTRQTQHRSIRAQPAQQGVKNSKRKK